MLDQKLIFYPCLTLIFLTGFILYLMFTRRIKAIKSGSVDMKYFKTYSTGDTEPRKVIQASRNFSNLMESPTLFYVLCVFALSMDVVDMKTLSLAWVYVFFRLVHSFIHVTSNKINPRLASYGLSWLTMLIMGGYIGYSISI